VPLPSVPSLRQVRTAVAYVLLCLLAATAGAGPARDATGPVWRSVTRSLTSPGARALDRAAGLLAAVEARLRPGLP
jgi:hypothetical protein